MQDILTVTLYSYFIGSIPTGLILSKIFSIETYVKQGLAILAHQTCIELVER